MKENCTHCGKMTSFTYPLIVFWYNETSGGYHPVSYKLCKKCFSTVFKSLNDNESEVENG